MKTFCWKMKPRVDVTSAPSVREVHFGDGHFQCAPAGLDADLKTYSMTLSVSRGEATTLKSFPTGHGDWRIFLWTPPYGYRRIGVTYAKWSSKVNTLRIGFSAEFKQVVN